MFIVESNLFLFKEYFWYVGIAQFILAIILFFIINWIGSHAFSLGYMQISVVIREDTAPAFNFIFKVIAPIVYLIIISAIAQHFGFIFLINNCYLIVVYYWIFRLIWNLSTQRESLINWSEQIFYWLCSISLAIWVYSIINNVEKILPDPKTLLDELWLLIILFIYSVFNKIQISRDKTIQRKENYLVKQYIRFHKKYNNIICSFFEEDFYKAITFSIMIYENFNRPPIARYLEYLSFNITHKPHTLGIMQVKSSIYIDNIESIKLAMEKIKTDSKNISKNQYFYYSEIVYQIAKQYNSGDTNYADEVSQIFTFIASKFYHLPSENPGYKS